MGLLGVSRDSSTTSLQDHKQVCACQRPDAGSGLQRAALITPEAGCSPDISHFQPAVLSGLLKQWPAMIV